jgi:hypothetical protein
MFVVFLVTSVALHRRVFVPIVLVAVFAGDRDMLMAKCIAGFVVVKSDFLPLSLGMAIGAGLLNRPLVLVVFLMAAVAI